ncbi:MAG: TIM-barrel domain-containing protein, partial [Acutalibacteraceae bacterium]
LHITVNLHPSMGVRWFEDKYGDFAEFMGIDPKSKKQIEFDLSDKKFIEGYFKFLHHPYEKDGVDFWWIDWQQGRHSQVEGLDPLWALNHYHSLDIKRDGKRPLILSRYAGAGTHRYPLGFSGDTAIYKSVLKFQPYFTSTASNIGYSWWSHDIGGHRGGVHDEELYLRWLQFGVFSPINRLHSTSNELMGKEPWNYSAPIHHYAAEALRLRHRLIPYIYSMNYRCAFLGETLIKPMYYEHPDDEWAYKCGSQYYFGSEMIVAPIFNKTDKRTSAAWVDVTLPEGEFTDIFTGTVYKGGQKIRMFRDIDSIPMLAKPGAIIPLDSGELSNDCSLPEEIETLVFNGSGSFDMYEDDGETEEYLNGKTAVTHFESEQKGNAVTFSVKTHGCVSLLPAKRKYTVSFRNIGSGNVVSDSDISVSTQSGYLKVSFFASPVCDITFRVDSCEPVKAESKKSRYIKVASRYSGFNSIKSLALRRITDGKTGILTPRKIKKQLYEIDKTL